MEPTLTAIELTGMVDEHHELQLDDVLPILGPRRVRVIVLYSAVDDWDEDEDIYTLIDGKPYRDEA